MKEIVISNLEDFEHIENNISKVDNIEDKWLEYLGDISGYLSPLPLIPC